jgi:hypothetical protein
MKQETNDESVESSLKKEAETYYNLSKEYKRQRYLGNETQAYVINKQWLKKWKEYVDYPTIKKNLQFSYYYSNYNNLKKGQKNTNIEKPGPINNDYLLVPITDFLNDGDENNPENQVLRHDIDQRSDIKLTNKDIWEFFYTRYGGGPQIIKGSIEEKSRYAYVTKKIIELFYRKVKLIFLI